MLARKRSLTLAPAGLLLLVFGNACSTDTPAGEVLTSDRENVLSLQGEGVIRFSLPPGVNEADVQRNYVRAQRLENGRCRFEGTPDTLRLGEAIRIFIIERNLATCEFIFGRAPAGMPTPQTGASDTVVHRFGLPIGRTDVRADAGVTVPGSSQSALVDTTSFRARDIVEVWGAGVTRYPFSAIDVDYTVDGSCVIGGYLQNEVSYNTVRIDHPSGFTGSGYGRWTRQEWQYMQNVPNCLGRPTLHAHWRFQTFS